jgi:hypothetical protein
LIRNAKKSVVWWSNDGDVKACSNRAVGGGDEGRGGDGEDAPSPSELIWVESINKKDPILLCALAAERMTYPCPSKNIATDMVVKQGFDPARSELEDHGYYTPSLKIRLRSLYT